MLGIRVIKVFPRNAPAGKPTIHVNHLFLNPVPFRFRQLPNITGNRKPSIVIIKEAIRDIIRPEV
jgi:hypothetical protein